MYKQVLTPPDRIREVSYAFQVRQLAKDYRCCVVSWYNTWIGTEGVGIQQSDTAEQLLW